MSWKDNDAADRQRDRSTHLRDVARGLEVKRVLKKKCPECGDSFEKKKSEAYMKFVNRTYCGTNCVRNVRRREPIT